jgi:hypothetical protein
MHARDTRLVNEGTSDDRKRFLINCKINFRNFTYFHNELVPGKLFQPSLIVGVRPVALPTNNN